jgi:hypothetical protein
MTNNQIIGDDPSLAAASKIGTNNNHFRVVQDGNKVKGT